MGFWDIIYSVGNGFKEITPDVSTVKRVAGSASNYTSAAVTKIDQVFRVDVIQKLPHYWPDSETRSQISLFATSLAKNTGKYAVYEGFKLIPGFSLFIS